MLCLPMFLYEPYTHPLLLSSFMTDNHNLVNFLAPNLLYNYQSCLLNSPKSVRYLSHIGFCL